MVTLVKQRIATIANGKLVTIGEYYGLSTDEKPEAGENSLFYELDTATIFYRTADSWVEVGQ